MHVELLNKDELKTFMSEVGAWASISHSSVDDPKIADKIGYNVLKSTHYSASRWFYFKFKVTGISRVCSHQLVRHGLGTSIVQQSGVFGETAFSEDTFIRPASYKNLTPELNEKLTALINNISTLYGELRELGISKSDARYIVPQGVETSMNFALDLESLMNFCERRLCFRAQPEVRSVAQEMVRCVVEAEPRLNDFFHPYCVGHGCCKEVQSCGYFKAWKKLNLD